ncbi:MAG: cytochrome c, partial [Acidobacteria bacterium]|nr:cytochrome c [Acidobacteriota bacterium]
PPPADPPAPGDAVNPVLGDDAAIAAGDSIYRARCVVCHRAGGGASPNLFRTGLPTGRFLDAVSRGRDGTNMPAFGELLSQDEIWQVHAFLMSRDGL